MGGCLKKGAGEREGGGAGTLLQTMEIHFLKHSSSHMFPEQFLLTSYA